MKLLRGGNKIVQYVEIMSGGRWREPIHLQQEYINIAQKIHSIIPSADVDKAQPV